MPRLGYQPGLGSSDEDGDGPFFVADIYELDLGPAPNFFALASAPKLVGVVLKATQGVSYLPTWFKVNLPRAKRAGGARYGASWFVGAYHYLTPYASGSDQADFYLRAVDEAGGWDDGMMSPICDLEGHAWSSPQQIVDVSSSFAERVKKRVGSSPILYAGALIRDLKITDRMGYRSLWTPRLSMTSAGWPLYDYCMWQYAGDGKPYDPSSPFDGYPLEIPNWGATDMNVVMQNGQTARDLAAVRSALTGRGSAMELLVVGASLAMIAYAIYKYASR
jgi:hypothetical protein